MCGAPGDKQVMKLTTPPVQDLGATTAKAVIRDALTLDGAGLTGRRVVDIGTGNGALVRWLLREGADAFGIEPNASVLRAALNDPKRPAPPGRWIAAAADRLPLQPASVDVVLFLNSLHHIPREQQVAALAEAATCLRPAGALIVVEPVAAGSFFELLAPLDDETQVRAAAQLALDAVRGRLFATRAEAVFTTSLAYPDPETVVAGFTRADPARAADARRVMPVIGERFWALGEPEPDGGRRFVQPMTLHHFARL